MTSNPSSNNRHLYNPDGDGGDAVYPIHTSDMPAWPVGPIDRLPQPRVIAVENFFGLDLGQVHDPTAIAILECSEILIGRSLVTYDWITVKRRSFRHLERLPLGLDYPTIVEHVRRLVSSPSWATGRR